MTGVVHVAHMGDGRNVYKALVERPEVQKHLEDLGVDGSIFKWIWLRIKTDGEVLYMRQ
jgi:hypothetical protein